jgi:hypothetical protein
MNLNKFTKAELISKINKYKHDKIERRSFFNKFKSYLSSFLDFLLKLKGIIGKLTLITFFLQLFRKYSIIRRIWKILNSIIVTIFEISFIDSFDFEFMNNLLIEFKIIISNTVDYLTNTHFYMFLSKLFSNPSSEIESKSNKTGSMMEEISRKTTNGERKSSESIRHGDRNSKISEWLKPESKIEPKPEPENINETNYIKYFIIGTTIIVISSLGFVYWEDIKSGGQSIMEWYFSSRSTGTNNPGTDTDSSTTPTGMNSSISTRPVSPDIEILDKTKMSSPSLEDLNEKVKESWNKLVSQTSSSSSPTSSSSSTDSNETIRASSSKVKIDDGIFLETRVVEQIVDNDWKNLIKSNVKESIEYVESHFPKSELEDSSYIEKLITDIKKENVNYAQEIRSQISDLSVNQLRSANALASKTDLWIETMEEKLKNLE